jgi:hypothetical protein
MQQDAQIRYYTVGFDVTTNNNFFWGVTSRNVMNIYQYIDGICCIHYQDMRACRAGENGW